MSNLITFPSNLRTLADKSHSYITFEIIDQQAPDFKKIHLYAPTGFNTADAASFGNVNLGEINALNKFASGGQDGFNQDEALVAGLKVIEKLGADANKGALAAQQKGIAFNPATALAFETMQLRTFNFEFKLVPESAEESETARRIENLFRKYMYPKKSGAFTLKYPPKFRIKFMHGEQENKYMPMIHDSYLVALDATANPEGHATFSNGAPTAVDIKLTFQESRMLTQDLLYTESNYDYDYNQRNNGSSTASTTGEN